MKRIVASIFAMLLLLAGCNSKPPEKKEVFIQEIYTEIEGECVIKPSSQEDILAMLKHGTGVVFLSWSGCPWCHYYIPVVNEIAREQGLEVLYYDIYEDRNNHTDFYKEVVSLIEDALASGNIFDGEDKPAFDSDGKPRIYVPELLCIENGEVKYHDNQGSMESDFDNHSEEYWSETKDGITRIDYLKTNMTEWFKEIAELKKIIDSQGCNDGCTIEKQD